METQSKDIVWFVVGNVSDWPTEGGATVLLEGEQIAVFNYTSLGKWFATQNLCPHREQMAISRGMIGDKNGEPKVACPFHKKQFSLQDGHCFDGDEYQLKTYPVKIEGTQVFVGI